MKTLTYNQQIRMEIGHFARGHRPEVTVGTVEGYAKQYNEDPNEAVSRCRDNMINFPHNGHCLAWTNQAASVITANYAGKAQDLAMKEAAYNNATVLVDGEVVQIEGREYKVKYLGDYADPIKFIPVA